MREYEYAAVLQGAILDKYGTTYGISKDLVTRIGNGTATSAELDTYTQNAARLVTKSKADMGGTAVETYSDQDIKIITAMAATHRATYQSGSEPVAKFVPSDFIVDTLKGNKAPAQFGFIGSKRHTAD